MVPKHDRSGAQVLELQQLFENPYAVHPGSEVHSRFYRKAPPGTYDGIGKAGQTFMS